MKQAINFEDVTRRARRMSDEALIFSRRDACEAAEMADKLEAAGCRVSKDGGYYRDEAGIYTNELSRRAARMSA